MPRLLIVIPFFIPEQIYPKQPLVVENNVRQASFKIVNLVVCILLRVLDQVQGFLSNATLFQ
jgi:hypothetical protein